MQTRTLGMLTVMAVAGVIAGSARAQVTVDGGVSVTIHRPGVYGRVVLGSLPPPPLVLPRPVIVHRTPVAVASPPMYLYVPPGHVKKWHKHCHRYEACQHNVYFVQERWIRERHAQARPALSPLPSAGALPVALPAVARHDHGHERGHVRRHGHGNKHRHHLD